MAVSAVAVTHTVAMPAGSVRLMSTLFIGHCFPLVSIFLFAQLTKGQATETGKLAYGGPKVGSVKLSGLKQQGYNR